jgi:signal peptidase I
VLVLIVVIIVLLLIKYLLPWYLITGDSMYPSFRNNEVVCALRLLYKSNLRKGNVYVFNKPYITERRILIKRLHKVISISETRHKKYYFLGDNAANSCDSRDFGYVRERDVIAKVLFKFPYQIAKVINCIFNLMEGISCKKETSLK